MSQQHALELAHSRAGERLQLVRDLHDGFGGTLVGAIARLEQAPADTPKAQVVDLLKEMRDDLRLVIDTTAQEQADLAQLIAPLRHRASRLLDAADIDARWQLEDLDGLQLEPARSLDLLRLLQEALTNVQRHAAANEVTGRLVTAARTVRLEVGDDGCGFDATQVAGNHYGLIGMRERARELGGRATVDSRPGAGTRIVVELPRRLA